MMRNRSVYSLAVSMLVVACLTMVGRAQQPAAATDKPASAPEQPAAAAKAQAAEVVLPVTVHDKKGAMVTDLNASDFTLTEDGRPQVIKNLTRQDNEPVRVGLLVDTNNSLSGAMDSERKAAEKFVDLMLPTEPKAGAEPDATKRPNEAFLIHFDREVELLEDFTDSRDKLHRELDEMGPTRTVQNTSQGPETSGDDRDSSQSRTHGDGTQLYDAIYLASGDLMKSKDGRKALVVFADGVDKGSKETLNDAVDAADKANLTVYSIYFKGEPEITPRAAVPGQRRGGMGGGPYPGGGPGGGYPGGGGGYPGTGGGNPTGGGQRPTTSSSSSTLEDRKIMWRIADRTGGRYFEAKRKDDLNEMYGRVADELRGEYLLTYTPDKVDTDGGFHKIVLKVDKKDMTVTTREGYYAPGEGSK